ncbi:hypothetical protein DNFV4_03576 [Nitrospira tepida]|uniref:Uncharacterized protein n=1 Tax=Nitrospira tepida TaxID=2973512 RepID=A0AA86N1M4_9BACT|nr:hypothetical protein [Nitrospira tepida]CAI4033143.1 hypothetical protein DNFV4_03576 [Nitrospira tepida]
MRLLDQRGDRKLDSVTIYLTADEARELRNDLDRLLANPQEHHAHVMSEDYRKEITVSIYDEANLEGFDARSKKLIREDI